MADELKKALENATEKQLLDSHQKPLAELHKEYIENGIKQNKEFEDTNEIERIECYLQGSPIKCTKYNYCLDSEVQNFSSFDSTL